MPERFCTVTYRDTQGISHSVEVTAATLYEAAVLGLAAFRKDDLTEISPGTGAELQITVKAPEITHSVPLRRLGAWLNAPGGRSPAEVLVKQKLRALAPWLTSS